MPWSTAIEIRRHFNIIGLVLVGALSASPVLASNNGHQCHSVISDFSARENASALSHEEKLGSEIVIGIFGVAAVGSLGALLLATRGRVKEEPTIGCFHL